MAIKILRRPRVSGSRTPWEQLCGQGFAAEDGGFVLVIDREGRLVAASPLWRRKVRGWWTWNAGKRWHDVVPAAEAKTAWTTWTHVLERALDSTNAFQTTVWLRLDPRLRIQIECVGQPILDRADRIVGSIVAGKFISPAHESKPLKASARSRTPKVADSAGEMLLACAEQIVALEGELRRAQRLATQGMVAAAIGHEVNNCLGIALANASLFQEQHGALGPAAKAISPVIYAVQTAGKICQRFRNLGTSARAVPHVIDLADVVQRACDMLSRIVARQFTFDRKSVNPLPVSADPTHIEQIVVNLVLNARDATTEGVGSIAVSVGRDDLDPQNPHHWIEVTDDGAGIPPKIQRKLFTAYFTTKPSKRGTGLGLATVMRLTKAMHGQVKLTSEVGHGTRVRINLPVASELAATVAASDKA